MFCSNCGAQLPDGSAFCSECGQHLVQAQPQQPLQQPIQQFTQPMPAYQQPTTVVNVYQTRKDPELGSSYATTSLVCGIIALLTCGIFLPSFILSIVGIKKAGTAKALGYTSAKRVVGKTLSIIALILSFVAPFILFISIFYSGISAYTERAQEASRQVQEHNSKVQEVQERSIDDGE